jgi:tetratricopeptide (TPR) repeat protein
VPELERRAYWPDGYKPAHVGPVGVEYATGQAFRLFSKFSDMSLQQFSGLFTALLFSLGVFAYYLIARSMWSCQAAGMFAAFAAAFFAPLVFRTDGGEFLHAPYAAVIAAFGLAAIVSWLRRPSAAAGVASALVAFVLYGVWADAGWYVAVITLAVVLSRHEPTHCRSILVAHVVAAVAAAVLLPHARVGRMLVATPSVFLYVAAAYAFVANILPRRVPSIVYVLAATVVVGAALRPFNSGAIETVSLMDYVAMRLRFVFGKPDDPTALTASVRSLWTYGHASPGIHGLVSFFLPVVLLVPSTILGLRAFRAETGRRIWPVILAAGLAVAMFAVDRSSLFVAAMIAFPLAGVSFFAFRKQVAKRLPWIAIAAAAIFAGSVWPSGGANPVYRLNTALGATAQQEEGFLWVSLGNADQDLVRYLVSRTSVTDLFVAPPRIASLMSTFAGRKMVVVPGIGTTEAAESQMMMMRSFYEDEDRFYDLCRDLGIAYVVYSIDVVLDSSRESVRYGAGVRYIPEEAVARDMHFNPVGLRHFTLVFENDNYRLFRVTDQQEPFFLTDHPPVYQETLFRKHSGNVDSFYAQVVDVLLTYSTAREAQDHGNDRDAIRRFRYCVEQAPGFTRAWIGVGDSMLRLNEIEASNAAYARALRLAPDNSHALYFGSVTLARLGKRNEAVGMLDVLLNSSADRTLIAQGQELKTYLENGGALDKLGSESN